MTVRRSTQRLALRMAVFLCLGCWFLTAPATASPWAEVGDTQLRSDIEILASAGVIDDITTQWPIPWGGLVTHLREKAALSGQPDYVREAARRVLAHAQNEMQFDHLRADTTLDLTNKPEVVRGFDALGLGEGQGQLSLEYMTSTTAVRLSAGLLASKFGNGKTFFMPDGSYIAQKIGGAVVYGGYLAHWWGPGWVSALLLSNNARPFPQIGIARDQTRAFDSPWLSWIGPWQMEFFVGLLDGPRIARNTIYVGARVAFNPLPHLEIGLSRTTEMCGTGHRCDPLKDYFYSPLQTIAHPNNTNDEAGIDFKYGRIVAGLPFEIYMQLMNEDNGPFVQSATSHLFGAGIWIPIDENPLRLTFEYSDSLATANIFSFGKIDYGTAYNNSGYLDGMRYRDRTLGFSLDSDSRLLSLQGSFVDSADRAYTVTFHRAQVSTPFTGSANPLTSTPVTIDLGEARVSIPFSDAKFDVVGRLQDDQLRPNHGFSAAFEGSLSIEL